MGLGSEIQDPEKIWIPDPGVKMAPDPDPQHFVMSCIPTSPSFCLNHCVFKRSAEDLSDLSRPGRIQLNRVLDPDLFLSDPLTRPRK
jgi:hypothetical protein